MLTLVDTRCVQIKLGMLEKDILPNVKPAVCHVVGANLFKAKGSNALDNSGVSNRPVIGNIVTTIATTLPL